MIPFPNDAPLIEKLSESYGVISEGYHFVDIFSFDEEILPIFGEPIFLVFLFPLGPKSGLLWNRHRDFVEQRESCPWFSTQEISNACGTMAILHGFMNNLEKICVKNGSWFGNFVVNSLNLSPKQRGDLIKSDSSLLELHNANSIESDIKIPSTAIDTHYSCFVEHNGSLWELDGRQPFPLFYGKCYDLMKQTIDIIQQRYIPVLDDPMKISLIGYTKSI